MRLPREKDWRTILLWIGWGQVVLLVFVATLSLIFGGLPVPVFLFGSGVAFASFGTANALKMKPALPPPPKKRVWELKAPDADFNTCPVCAVDDLEGLARLDVELDRDLDTLPPQVVEYGKGRAHALCAELRPYVAPPLTPQEHAVRQHERSHHGSPNTTVSGCPLCITEAQQARHIMSNAVVKVTQVATGRGVNIQTGGSLNITVRVGPKKPKPRPFQFEGWAELGYDWETAKAAQKAMSGPHFRNTQEYHEYMARLSLVGWSLEKAAAFFAANMGQEN